MAQHLLSDGNVRINPATEDTLAKAITAATSVLYDGGGTSNALRDTIGTSALPSGAAVISVGTNSILEVFLTDATAAETITLNVAEYSAASPTIATLIRNVPVSMGADQARTVDRACVGLTTGTEHYCKTPVRVSVTPGSYIELSVQENITGSAYCRYMLKGAL